jgi:hypothetical protein
VFRVLGCTAGLGLAFSPSVNLLFRYRDYAFLWRLVVLISAGHALLTSWSVRNWHAIGAAVGLTVSTSLLNVTIYLRSRRLASLEARQTVRPPMLQEPFRKAA